MGTIELLIAIDFLNLNLKWLNLHFCIKHYW